MSVPMNVFQEYLSPEEIVVETGDGAIGEGSSWRDGFVGLTDRRLLFVSDDGEFTNVDYDHVCSIESRTRRTFTERGFRLRLLGAFGGFLAFAAFVTMVVLASSAVGTLLAFVAVGGVVVAESLRRAGVDVDWDAIEERLPGLGRRAVIENAVGDRTKADDGGDSGIIRQHWESEYVYVHQLLLVSAAVFATIAVGGLVAHTGGLLVMVPAVATIVGIAAVDFAVRRIRRLDSVGGSRRDEREVRIQLVNGRDVSVRFDAAARTDRVLSKLASVSAMRRSRDPVRAGLVRP